MKVVTADQLAAVLTPELVMDALKEAFKGGIKTPLRHHHFIERANDETATLLLMPAWHETASNESHIGIKVVSVFPKNVSRQKPTILGSYLLLSGASGEVQAIMDATSITVWRTAAASALAASFLARQSASHLVVLGAGALAPYLIKAHMAIRPITKVTIWNRSGASAKKLAGEMAVAMSGKAEVAASEDLEHAVRSADIVSAATLSKEPLIRGTWLKPGTHVDLVGGFTPAMREADDDAVRASAVFVDTREGATREAGDIVQPLKRQVIGASDIKADLADLCRSVHIGRESDQQITLFKSVGTAIEDLALATLVYRRLLAKDIAE